jgi:hypothetical protein
VEPRRGAVRAFGSVGKRLNKGVAKASCRPRRVNEERSMCGSTRGAALAVRSRNALFARMTQHQPWHSFACRQPGCIAPASELASRQSRHVRML